MVQAQSGLRSADTLREHVLEDLSQDRLGRAAIAHLIHGRIVAASPGVSVRIAILGDWGSGKTTVAEWATELLEPKSEWLMVRYSPWNAVTTEEVWDGFGTALRDAAVRAGFQMTTGGKTKAVAKKLEGIGRTISDAHGLLKGLHGVLKRAGQYRQEDIEKLIEAIGGRRVAIIIDDLDRTDPHLLPKLFLSLRDVLEDTGFIFLVPFDSAVVTRAIAAYSEAWGQKGELFLEKIFDYRIMLPSPSPSQRVAFLDELTKAALPEFRSFRVPAALGTALPHVPRRLKAIARQLLMHQRDIARHDPDEIDHESLIVGAAMKAESEAFFSAFVERFANRTLEDEATAKGTAKLAEDNERVNAIFIGEIFSDSQIGDIDARERLKKLSQLWLMKAKPNTWTPPIRALRLFVDPPPLTNREYKWITIENNSLKDVQKKWSKDFGIIEQSSSVDMMSHATIDLRVVQDALMSERVEGRILELLCTLKRNLVVIRAVCADPNFVSSATTNSLRFAAYEAVLGRRWTLSLRVRRNTSLGENASEIGRLRGTVLYELASYSGEHWEDYADSIESSARGAEYTEELDTDPPFREIREMVAIKLEGAAIEYILNEFQSRGGLERMLGRLTTSFVGNLLLNPESRLWRSKDGYGPLPSLLLMNGGSDELQRNAMQFEAILFEKDQASPAASQSLGDAAKGKVGRDPHSDPWSRVRANADVRTIVRHAATATPVVD